MLMTLSYVYLLNQRDQNSQSNFWMVLNFLMLHSDQIEVAVFVPKLLRAKSADLIMNVGMTYDLAQTFNPHIKGLKDKLLFITVTFQKSNQTDSG